LDAKRKIKTKTIKKQIVKDREGSVTIRCWMLEEGEERRTSHQQSSPRTEELERLTDEVIARLGPPPTPTMFTSCDVGEEEEDDRL